MTADYHGSIDPDHDPEVLAWSQWTMIITMYTQARWGYRPWAAKAREMYAAHCRGTTGGVTSKARVIMAWRPDLAQEVANGRMTLWRAYRAARVARAEAGVSWRTPQHLLIPADTGADDRLA